MSKTLTIDGITRTLWEWAKIKNISYDKLNARVRLKIPIEKIFECDLKSKRQRKRRIGNPDALPYRWNDTAITCYELGCNCQKCILVPEWFKKQCQMKQQVRELVRIYGKPESEET